MLATMLLRRKRARGVATFGERPAKRSRLLTERPSGENGNENGNEKRNESNSESGNESDASFVLTTDSAFSSEAESESEGESESDDGTGVGVGVGVGVKSRPRNTDRSSLLQLTVYDKEQAAQAQEEASKMLVTGKRVRAPRRMGTEWYLDEELDADGEHVIPPHTVVPIVVDSGAGDDPDAAPVKAEPKRWIVQRITSMRRDDKTQKVSVRVKWLNLDVCEATWEPFGYICRKAPIPMTRYCVNLIKKDPELNAERIESKLRAFCAAVVERAF